MSRRSYRQVAVALAVATVGITVAAAPATMTNADAKPGPVAAGRTLAKNTVFYKVPPYAAQLKQIADLKAAGNDADAALLTAMVNVPSSAWFEAGTPRQVRAQMKATLADADRQHAVPVLVAYNIPYRDCAGYSTGGAKTAAEYKAWVAAFASAIGNHKAVVILETDAIGIIPFNKDLGGNAEWCQPMDKGKPAPEADPAHRYALLNYGVDKLEKRPNVSVYLDGTTSSWLGAGEAAYRLDKAGVRKAQGFFLNTSNFQPTSNSVQFGTWVSKCLAATANGVAKARGHYELCEGPYSEKGPDYSAAYVKWVDAQYAKLLGRAKPTTHFVIDTSRNGRGFPDLTTYAKAPYNQPAKVTSALPGGGWCNPRGAGAGARPTADTHTPLVDAFLWIKIPGESDGTCDINGGVRAWDYTAYNPWNVPADQQGHFDPLWGRVDPAAGDWFDEQALELAKLAVPTFSVK